MMHASRSERRLGFQIHAVGFVPTIVALFAINVWTGQPYWVQWVLLGWGVGLIAHWWFVLGPGANSADKS